MLDTFRDAPVGQVLRSFGQDKLFPYVEELPGFEFPDRDGSSTSTTGGSTTFSAPRLSSSSQRQLFNAADFELKCEAFERKTGRKGETEELESWKQQTIKTGGSGAGGGVVLVDWYDGYDAENPQNWSSFKKGFVTFLICLYTFVVYCGSAIFVPSAEGLIIRYHVSPTVVSLGLALYVCGYGVGPMIFSPMSEIAVIGRNMPYILSLLAFVGVSLAAAEVDDFGLLMFFRFCQGFLGSPCLASGGASLQDMYSTSQLPYAFIVWVAAICCGPALGPSLSAHAVVDDWRWSLREILFMGIAVFLLLAVCLPETSGDTILLHRAERLRKVTGTSKFRAPCEAKRVEFGALVSDALVKPVEIAIKDPAIGFACLYGALIYATYYSFFEAFPIVYQGTYGMSLGQTSLVYLTIIVATAVGAGPYTAWLYFVCGKQQRNGGDGCGGVSHESRLVPALVAVFFLPLGLGLFASSSRQSVHWIVPTIGIGAFAGGAFIIFQCLIVYVSLSYPRYTASLLAAADFLRSTTAAGTVMFSRTMYLNIGIPKAVGMLAGLSCLGIIGMFCMYFYGAVLRSKSRFASRY